MKPVQQDPGPRASLAALRRGEEVFDDNFDRVFSESARELSGNHWTPVWIAIKAAKLLAVRPQTRVLDVGCGAGKFCLVGALATSGSFFGIEQHGELVAEAATICRTYGIGGAQFFHGNMTTIDWRSFDAFYLFNPFYESRPTFGEYVEFVRNQLATLAIGTRVVLYQGFGGTMPDCYTLSRREIPGTDFLNLWIKSR